MFKILSYIDDWGIYREKVVLDPGYFQQLEEKKEYFKLAEACVDGLHQLYKIDDHNSWYHGISDAWAFWVVMMMQCSVKNCSELPYELLTFTLKNTNAWRALSGSDDVLWASLILANRPDFLDMGYQFNGARGARQLYNEATDHYIIKTGNYTALYWDTNHDYTATISMSLLIAASTQLHQKIGGDEYLDNALSVLGSLLQNENGALITEDGHVYDGRHHNKYIQSVEWTYNSGVALAALTLLYESTKVEEYFLRAEKIAQTAITVFWKSGHLAEVDRYVLNKDQYLFKGILLHYLAKFLRVLDKKNNGVMPPWVLSLKSRIENESTWLVNNRLTSAGFCVYWGESGATETCKNEGYEPQGMVTASQLFSLASLLQQLVPDNLTNS
jgi:predicted alpha-1,6-mannanase (GH76 family)